MDMNTRNVNAAGKASTIHTARRLNEALAAFHERRYLAHQRFLALEDRFKRLTNTDVAYVLVNGITMPMPRI